jgi:sensor histidine kinase YesM
MIERTLRCNPLALLSVRHQLVFTFGINTFIGLLLTLMNQPLVNAMLYSHCIGFSFFAWFLGYGRLFRFRLATVWLPLLLGGATGLAIAIVLSGLLRNHGLPEIIEIVSREQQALSATFLLVLLLGALGFSLVVGGARILAANNALQQARIRQLEADKQLAQSQLQLLQAQIEPHFLFNTLSTIGALIDTSPPQGKAMLEHFTRYLRATLRRSRATGATLGDELELIGDYLALLELRLGERLRYRITAPTPLRSATLPPMLLQPLVENAIRHGIEPAVDGGEVTIDATVRNHILRIQIADSGVGLPQEPGFGFGLTNIRERLFSLYGTRARLSVQNRVPQGVLATIEVPYDHS